MPDPTAHPSLPATLQFERHGDVGLLRLDRESKRNAVDDVTLLGLDAFFGAPPDVAAIVIDAAGPNFCAGLDLSSVVDLGPFEAVRHSRGWHRAMGRIESCPVPVVAALKGAVIGGGLEIAAAAHLRVADATTFFALPEGQRGLFVGGGGSVRIPRLIGAHRMIDMMLTGRVYDAQQGHDIGLAQYLTEAGAALDTALGLARTIAATSPVTTFAVLQVLPRIAASGPDEGSMMESLMAAVASSSDEARGRLTAFLEGRAAKVAGPGSAGPGSAGPASAGPAASDEPVGQLR